MNFTRITDLHFATPKTVRSGQSIALIILCNYAQATPGQIDLTILGPGPAPATITPTSLPVQPGFNSLAASMTIHSPPGFCIVTANLDGDDDRDGVSVT